MWPLSARGSSRRVCRGGIPRAGGRARSRDPSLRDSERHLIEQLRDIGVLAPRSDPLLHQRRHHNRLAPVGERSSFRDRTDRAVSIQVQAHADGLPLFRRFFAAPGFFHLTCPPSCGTCIRMSRSKRRIRGRDKTGFVVVSARISPQLLAKIDSIVRASEYPTSRASVVETLIVRALNAQTQPDGIRAAV